MNKLEFRGLLQELIDENPFACRALLKILAVEFTDSIPTLAVTVSAQPRLLVNLGFINEHCQTDAHIKAVVCHEFLHVLLRHTDGVKPTTGADHLALDAVINAIIHRALGAEYSDFMKQYYANETGVRRLLRPFRDGELKWSRSGGYQGHDRVWDALYGGLLVADDIRDVAQDASKSGRLQQPKNGWLGNHTELRDDAEDTMAADAGELSQVVKDALNRALKAMNGEGIWRGPKAGVAAHVYRNQVSAAKADIEVWRRKTFAVLKKHLLPDQRAEKNLVALAEFRLPILNTGDRRSLLRALWSPLIPETIWHGEKPVNGGAAHVYLDVSGSMNAEMPLIVALLARLGAYIRRPFWAFSNVVVPAVIREGRLHADTTGGTSINCVLEHVGSTRPASAVIVTDGYIETVDKRLLERTRATKLHAIVTRDGSPSSLHSAGIPYTQLGSLPK